MKTKNILGVTNIKNEATGLSKEKWGRWELLFKPHIEHGKLKFLNLIT